MTSDKNSLVVHGHVIDNSSSEEVSSSIIKEETKKTWTSYIWDTLDKSPQERRFLFKLDLAVLTFASLGEFCCPSPRHLALSYNEETSRF